jgi:prepilin-type N-terminal cleavage/methylation domain-containing protein
MIGRLTVVIRRCRVLSGGGQGTRFALRRGFTLVELMVALTVIGIISAAVVVLIEGASNSDSYLRACNTAESEIDIAVRRVANNIMEAQTGSIVVGSANVTSGSTTVASATLTTLTQPDNANSYPFGVTVIYTLQADPSNPGQFILTENDQRYGTNTLVHNVKTFNIGAVSGFTNLYQIDLVLGGVMANERHFKVYAPN